MFDVHTAREEQQEHSRDNGNENGDADADTDDSAGSEQGTLETGMTNGQMANDKWRREGGANGENGLTPIEPGQFDTNGNPFGCGWHAGANEEEPAEVDPAPLYVLPEPGGQACTRDRNCGWL
jgi:hypothetical protein